MVKSKTAQPGLVEFTKTVKMAPYPYKVRVIVTSDVNQSIINRPRLVGPHERDPEIEAMRCEDVRLKGISYLFIPFKLSIGDLAHEAYHAVRSMLRYIATESEEEEVVAHHLGHLFAASYKHLNDSIKQRDKPVTPVPCEAVLVR